MFNILVVEDDRNLRKLMQATLKQKGYITVAAENGEEALDKLDVEHIDLVISDVMMPIMDGYELVKILRESKNEIPILMVTAKDAFEDKKNFFSFGVDDYMVKPIDINELVLRVEAILRRAKIVTEHVLSVGNITLDYNSLTITQDEITTTLPQKEFYLLYMLLSYPNIIFTRRQLLDEIWGMEHEVDERTVDVHIKRLREKFSGCMEFDILTVRGLGYKLEKNI